MSVLRHDAIEIRRQGALGVGLAELGAAADACDSGGEHLAAAELMYAACAVGGIASGVEAKRAWTSICQLEKAGGGSSASRALESRVLPVLVLAPDGYKFGSAEQEAALQRMKMLARRPSLKLAQTSKEAMEVNHRNPTTACLANCLAVSS